MQYLNSLWQWIFSVNQKEMKERKRFRRNNQSGLPCILIGVISRANVWRIAITYTFLWKTSPYVYLHARNVVYMYFQPAHSTAMQILQRRYRVIRFICAKLHNPHEVRVTTAKIHCNIHVLQDIIELDFLNMPGKKFI